MTSPMMDSVTFERTRGLRHEPDVTEKPSDTARRLREHMDRIAAGEIAKAGEPLNVDLSEAFDLEADVSPVEDESGSVVAKVADSGARRSFPTGSVRDIRSGKGRFDLIPPEFMFRLARHFEAGSAKYGDRNWEKGQPLGVYFDSACRHAQKVMLGIEDEDHEAAWAWNVAAFITTRERIRAGLLPAELDDMP